LPPSKKRSRPEAIVTRDSSFQRAVADKVVAFDLGRDVEVSFLQGGPIIQKLVDLDEKNEQLQLTGSLTELVRVRLSPSVALNMAINVISTLTDAGKIKKGPLRDAILQMLTDDDTTENEVSE
jgi:hypothetical protein